MSHVRFCLKLLYSPLFLVSFLTLAPFVIPFVDFLNDYTRGLSRYVGIDYSLYFYALLCVMAFCIGYGFFIGKAKRKVENVNKEIPLTVSRKCRRTVIVVVFVLVGITVAVVFYTVSSSYMAVLIQSIIAGEENPSLRWSSEGFIGSESVPGLVRMFAHCAVGCLVLMYAIGLVAPSWLRKWRGYWILILITGLAILARSLLVLDRSVLVILLSLGIFVLAHRLRFTKFQIVTGFLTISFFLFTIVAFLTVSYSIRVESTDRYNQILEYADLGVANASLAYRTTSHFGWGTSTLMGPIRMVPRGVGINFEFPLPDSEWIWSTASNLLCLSLREFWIFGFLVYLIYGIIIGFVLMKRNKHPLSIFWGVSQLWSIYFLLGIWTQPAFDSPDVWIAIFATLFSARYLDRLVFSVPTPSFLRLNRNRTIYPGR